MRARVPRGDRLRIGTEVRTSGVQYEALTLETARGGHGGSHTSIVCTCFLTFMYHLLSQNESALSTAHKNAYNRLQVL